MQAMFEKKVLEAPVHDRKYKCRALVCMKTLIHTLTHRKTTITNNMNHIKSKLREHKPYLSKHEENDKYAYEMKRMSFPVFLIVLLSLIFFYNFFCVRSFSQLCPNYCIKTEENMKKRSRRLLIPTRYNNAEMFFYLFQLHGTALTKVPPASISYSFSMYAIILPLRKHLKASGNSLLT